MNSATNKKTAAVIGVTGPSGSGKSVLCGFLAQLGCYVVDCDKLARLAVRRGTDCHFALVTQFGTRILYADGRLNRRALASIAFSDAESTQKLNSITHPAILALVQKRLEWAAKMRKTAVLDAPLLIESGLDSVCDAVACLNAPAALCRNRIMQRDGIDENEAEKRLAARRPLENGGDIMYYTNDGSITQLEQFARRVYLTATENHNRRHG